MSCPSSLRPAACYLLRRASCAPLVVAVVGMLTAAQSAPAGDELAAALDSITAEGLYEHVEVLADDEYEGREAGSRGGRAAGRYIVEQLRDYDLTPAGRDTGFYQPFDDGYRNILALRPGTDPQLADEVIVVGAHYDHLGHGIKGASRGPSGQIFNGADDNASGVAVLLEIIDALAESDLATRRSILFAFWDAEEIGMLGSRHWLDHPTVRVQRVRLKLSVDCVGRLSDGQLYILGAHSGHGLQRLLSGPADGEYDSPLELDFTWDAEANSDHWPFLKRKIPAVLLHTGSHADYHRPTDDVEKVNREGMRDVGRYLLSVLVRAADADQLPEFRPGTETETADRQHADEHRPSQHSTNQYR
jgi:hypothetical protein